MAAEQAKIGVSAVVWSLDSHETAARITDTNHYSQNFIRAFPVSWPGSLGFSHGMEQAASSDRLMGTVVVHQHMIWLMYSRIPAILRANNAAKVVIAPHGALDDWALRKSRCKKSLARWMYEDRNLQTADCLQATSEREVSNIRDFGLTNPIALISNGVSQSLVNSQGVAGDFRDRFGIPDDRRIMLFISRIAPQKGLPMMLDAIDRLRDRLRNWVFVIGGLDQDGHEREVKARVEQLSLRATVRFVGPLFGQLKRNAFEAADLFVLPSHCEGSPMIVLEALAAGVPVLTTKAAAWDELAQANCGWCCEISTAALCDALDDVLTLSESDLKSMRCNARRLVAERYTWSNAVQKTVALYSWLHGKSDPPQFMVLD